MRVQAPTRQCGQNNARGRLATSSLRGLDCAALLIGALGLGGCMTAMGAATGNSDAVRRGAELDGELLGAAASHPQRRRSAAQIGKDRLEAACWKQRTTLDECNGWGWDRTKRVNASVRVMVDAQGELRSVKVTSLREVKPCIEKTIAGWDFPELPTATSHSFQYRLGRPRSSANDSYFDD